MKTHKFGIGLAIGLLVIATSGCGKVADKVGQKVTEKGFEKAVEHQSGGKVDLDLDSNGGGLRVKGEDGSAYEVGNKASIPDDWPQVLELPKGFDIASATTMKEDRAVLSSVIAIGDGDGDKIFETFRSRIESAGYEIIQDINQRDPESGEGMQSVRATRDSSSVSVSMANDPAKNEITLSLSSSRGLDN